ncbi:MAG: hypothetical protein ACQEP1_00495 [Nanobdellota archaeon]
MRYKRTDTKNAESIIQAADKEMRFTLSLPVNEDSASTIARNIYECFRMLGEGLLILRGESPQDHLEPINAIVKLQIDTPRSLSLLHTYRKIRHNINYYGYLPETEEVKDMVDFSTKCFSKVYDHITKMIS